MVFYFTATGNSLYVAKCIDEYPVSIPQAIKIRQSIQTAKSGLFALFIAAKYRIR